MTAAGHILILSMASNAPTKLSIYFGLSSLPPWFFELEQSMRRDLLDLLTKVKCKDRGGEKMSGELLSRL